MSTHSNPTPILRNLVVSLVSLAAFVALVEGGFALVRHASWLQRPGVILQTARMLYLERRATVQYLPACARHDPVVSYTLRPGECEFANDEFRTRYAVNSLGLRDDEESLVAPEIIVAGDSYAMGWGVKQDEAFPQVVERLTGRKVLNAAVSSYGTARELKLLERVDRSKLRHLIIQYSGNDRTENEAFLRGEGHLETMSAESYASLVAEHERRRRYWPGAYAWTYLRAVQSGMRVGRPSGSRGSSSPAPPPRIEGELDANAKAEAEAFLGVLERSLVDLGNVRVTVLVMATSPTFTEAVLRAVDAGGTGSFAPNLEVIDVRFLLAEDDFYRLDDHLRAVGHERIAAHVADRIAASGW